MTKYDLTLSQAEGQTEEEVCVIESFYPKVGVAQIWKRYREYFNSYKVFNTFQNLNAELKHGFKW